MGYELNVCILKKDNKWSCISNGWLVGCFVLPTLFGSFNAELNFKQFSLVYTELNSLVYTKPTNHIVFVYKQLNVKIVLF